MKRTTLKICSVVLIVTMLMSMFALLPTNAAHIDTEQNENTKVFTTAEDEYGIHFYGPTGTNISDKKDFPEDTEIIDSVSEYKDIAGTSANSSKKLLTRATNLPDSVDNSQSIYFPEIGNQGHLGSCLYWGLVYYQYTYEYNRLMNIPTTPENTFSPQWSYNVVTSGQDMRCNKEFCLDFMKYQGSVPMSQVPYDYEYLKAYPTEDVWRNSINYRIKDFYYLDNVGTEETKITSPDDSDLDILKTALSNGEVLTYSTLMDGWSYTNLTLNDDAPENYNHNGEYAVASMDCLEGGHRMTLVGYNDDIWIDINKNGSVDKGEMGAFKVANSWDTDYCNGGFVWVAYDALNYVSCVDGVKPNKYRETIFQDIIKLVVQPYGTDTDLYLRYTLNTANRTQVLTSITAQKDGTARKVHAQSNMLFGDSVAYDGTTNATDANLIFPIQSAFPDVTSENFTDYTWSVEFKDMTYDDYTLTVKNAEIVDEASDQTYRVDNTYPFELNGDTKSILYNESDLNHAVIYYRGFYTPSISYKLNNSAKWQNNIAIPKDPEKHGYTHKFVIDLGTSDKAKLYFSDENGSVDNNNGTYFTATRGLNYFVTENVGKELKVKMTNDLGDVADVGRFGLFHTEVSGGYEPYVYEYVYTNLDTGEVTVDDYFEISERGHYFYGEYDYKITVNVKDYAGTIVSDENYVSFIHIPFEFTTFEATGQNNTIVNGHEITFTAITNFENIGVHYGIYNEYDITIKRGSESWYSATIPMEYDMTDSAYMTTTVTTKWTPTQPGTYTATISSTDCAGEYAEKTIVFKVNDCIIGDADGDGKITIMDTTFVQMHLARALEKDRVRTLTADADKDKKISINDATYIQRYVANLDNVKYVGEVINP